MPANNYKDRKLIQVTGAKGDPGQAGPQGAAGVGTPTGGTTGQVLAKLSGTNYDFTWVPALASPTGTGFFHATVGAADAAAKLVDTADINAAQVTYAKIQNVSATDTILGRKTSGAGSVEEITVSGDITQSGSTFTIENSAVTLAKMANMSSGTLIYRKSVASGPPETQSLSTLKTDLGLAGTNSGDQTITLTEDVTGSGTGSFATTVSRLNGTSLAGLATGLLKNSTGTGVPSIATGADLPTMTSTVGGGVPTPPNNTTTFLRGDGTFAAVTASIPAGTGVIDFGSGNDTASVVITDASVSTSSKITLSLTYNASLSLGRDVDEMLIDPITLMAVPGTGNFTVYGAALQGTVVGKYGISYTAA